MSFKNKKGDVPWYVIALILALVVLVVSLFAIPKIRDAQKEAGGKLKDTCTIAGGTCEEGDVCRFGSKMLASCPDTPSSTAGQPGTKQICCKA